MGLAWFVGVVFGELDLGFLHVGILGVGDALVVVTVDGDGKSELGGAARRESRLAPRSTALYIQTLRATSPSNNQPKQNKIDK